MIESEMSQSKLISDPWATLAQKNGTALTATETRVLEHVIARIEDLKSQLDFGELAGALVLQAQLLARCCAGVALSHMVGGFSQPSYEDAKAAQVYINLALRAKSGSLALGIVEIAGSLSLAGHKQIADEIICQVARPWIYWGTSSAEGDTLSFPVKP
jgi:hypothetical protein